MGVEENCGIFIDNTLSFSNFEEEVIPFENSVLSAVNLADGNDKHTSTNEEVMLDGIEDNYYEDQDDEFFINYFSNQFMIMDKLFSSSFDSSIDYGKYCPGYVEISISSTLFFLFFFLFNFVIF
jgi:hypothetical protein